jgi:glycerate kinase
MRPDDFALAENCLRRLKTVMEKSSSLGLAATPGAGAAGGLGFGLMAFAGAKPRPGFAVFADAARLEERIRWSDVVLTGEGAVDRQTRMGKGVGQILRLCRKLNVPCIALAGVVESGIRTAPLFSRTFALTDITTLAEAKRRPARHLEKLSTLAASGWRV